MTCLPFCIPGFLGLSADFAWVKSPHHVVPLLNDKNLALSFKALASTIVSQCKKLGSTDIIGYSLGGRIALHALCAEPSYFRRAIIISTHTGLYTDEERLTRLKGDKEWAQRFIDSPWSEAIDAWNKQEVLQGMMQTRSQDDYDKSMIAHALLEWSLGKQENLLPHLQSITTKTVWITGERDIKFTAIAKQASQVMPDATHVIISNCGHRVMVEAPTNIAEIASSFLK